MKKFFVTIIILIFISSYAFGDNSSAQFLLVGQGARAEAMGQSLVSNCFDYTATYWNPGAIPFVPQGEIGFARTEFPTTISNNFLSLVYPSRHFGFGFSAIICDTSMTFYDNVGDEISSGDGEKSKYYSLAFAYRISQFFSLGFSVGQTSMELFNVNGANYESKALNFSLGGIYRYNRLSLGFQTKVSGKLSFEKDEELPEFFSLGASYNFLRDENLLATFSYTSHFNDKEANSIGAGMEYEVSDKLFLRGGYNYKKEGGGVTPSVGIGFKTKRFTLDYAYTPNLASLDQMTFHKMGISFRFGELRSMDYKIEASPPEVVLQYFKNNNKTFEPTDNTFFVDNLTLVGSITTDSSAVLDSVIIKNNGKDVSKKTSIGKQKYILNETIVLKEGVNVLNVVAVDSNRKSTKSFDIHVVYERNILKGDASIEEFIDFVSNKGKNWAVLIGINDYPKENGFTKLDDVTEDVNSFKQSLLRDVKNFEEERIYTLGKNTWSVGDKCNYRGPATKENIEAFLGDEFPNMVKPDDRVLVFYSGHGITLDTIKSKEKQGFLAPIDGKKDKPFSTCISMDIVNQLSERIPAKQMLFVIDACNSGLAITRNKGDKDKKNLKRRIESFMTNSRQAMTASKSNESSKISSEYKQSTYTHYFLEGLKGAADTDRDGVVSILELHVYVRGKVVADSIDNDQTPQMGRLKDGGEGEYFFILTAV